MAVAQEEEQEDERDEPHWPFPLDNVDDESDGVGRLAGIEEETPLTRELEYDNPSEAWQSEEAPDPDSRRPLRSPGRNLNPSLQRGKEYPMYYRHKAPTAEIQLEKILYSYIEHDAARLDTTKPGWTDACKLSHRKLALLESNKHSVSTIKSWADIVTNSDPRESAAQLEALQTRQDVEVVPLFVLFYTLRKPYIGPRTLRVLLRVSFKTVERYELREGGLDKEDLFTLFTLLLRRTRDVWPTAMESLVDMLLRYLPHNPSNEQETLESEDSTGHQPITLANKSNRLHNDQLASLGFRLNKAMRLLAVPTSINPFKTLNTQESCIIRILRFLAEHDPPLEINRDGFRAVILMQLAQPKAKNDRLWAELKSLSWPPWKEDRTAMDSDVTAAEQGRSKAAETLQRMREAGFAPYDWETVAAIYTGWDTDRTPTIQTRVLFSSGKKRFESGAAMWVARIRTTRTIQEAWACYLAYEYQSLECDQDVCLAMFRKLYEEDARMQNTRKYMHFRRVRTGGDIWPGDAMEIEPPPPSSHQHTYTRTAPPTLYGFYRQLKEKGVVFEGHCLAFLISRANTLQLGLDYLLASEPVYPKVRRLLDFESSYDSSGIPDTVFAAFMELLGRFSNLSLTKALPTEMEAAKRALKIPVIVDRFNFNPDHPLVHGIRLLSQRLPHYRPAWNSILQALGNSSSHQMLNAALFETHTTPGSQQTPKAQDERVEQSWKAAYIARRLVIHVTALMRSIHLETDPICFMALCNVAENLAVSCWLQMRQQALKDEEVDVELESAAKMLDRHNYPKAMRRSFLELVGDQVSSKEVDDKGGPKLPSLVEVPSPAILHAYIRVLGWMGDYTGLLETADWMRKYRKELQERRQLDKNGEVVMRRAVVALRVFLERSWIKRLRNDTDSSDSTVGDDLGWTEKIKRGSTTRHGRSGVSMSQVTLRRLQTAANEKYLKQVKPLVKSIDDWGGWPTDEEVHDYCQHERFQQFNQ